MIGLGKAIDLIKLGAAGLAGAGLASGLILAWVNIFAIPAAEQTGYDRGEADCRADVAKEHAAEMARQQAANDAALERSLERERELAVQADDLNEQLMDLANAITSDPGAADACIGPERVRDLNAIR
ncbi:MAG: hypothetical protein AAGI03_04185 [Pseudomonadota bacterium]